MHIYIFSIIVYLFIILYFKLYTEFSLMTASCPYNKRFVYIYIYLSIYLSIIPLYCCNACRYEKKKKKKTKKRQQQGQQTQNRVNIMVYEKIIVLLFPYTHECSESSITVTFFNMLWAFLWDFLSWLTGIFRKRNITILLELIYRKCCQPHHQSFETLFFYFKWSEDPFNIWPEKRLPVIFWMRGQKTFASSESLRIQWNQHQKILRFWFWELVKRKTWNALYWQLNNKYT